MNPHYRTQRSLLWLAPLALFALGMNAARAEVQTRITSTIGSETSQNQTLSVNPGDAIQLSADDIQLDGQSSYELQSAVEDFRWSSDASSQDVCDPEVGCVGTNFDVNNWGVTFYVPENMGSSIRITATSRNGGTATIELLNNSYNDQNYIDAGYRQAPQDVAFEPNDYVDSAFDVNRALVGQGNWIYVKTRTGFKRAFVAHYMDNPLWQPMQRGEWDWTEDYGWTWNGYESASWILDHYGYYRHLRTRNIWVWFPFEGSELYWRPYVGTMFNVEQSNTQYGLTAGIGWFPYYPSYAQGYVDGYDDGYDDGFWDGYMAGLNARRNRYVWGWTYVPYNYFWGYDVYRYRYVSIDIYNHYDHCYHGRNGGRVLIRDHRNRSGGDWVIVRDHRDDRGHRYIRNAVERYGRVRVVSSTVTKTHLKRLGGGEIDVVYTKHRNGIPDAYVKNRQEVRNRYRHGERVRVVHPEAPRVNRGGRIVEMPSRRRDQVRDHRSNNGSGNGRWETPSRGRVDQNRGRTQQPPVYQAPTRDRQRDNRGRAPVYQTPSRDNRGRAPVYQTPSRDNRWKPPVYQGPSRGRSQAPVFQTPGRRSAPVYQAPSRGRGTSGGTMRTPANSRDHRRR